MVSMKVVAEVTAMQSNNEECGDEGAGEVGEPLGLYRSNVKRFRMRRIVHKAMMMMLLAQ
jgi:hypothetical protein